MTGSIASLASGYSIMETIDIKLNGNGDQINYSSSTTLYQAVPEPSSLAVAGLGAGDDRLGAAAAKPQAPEPTPSTPHGSNGPDLNEPVSFARRVAVPRR